MTERRLFPIMGRTANGERVEHAISWEVAELFRAQAKRNHGQSLERLAQRGGLSWMEAANALAGLDPFSSNCIKPDQPMAQAMLAGAAHALARLKERK
jgi:hypothetical protein